MLEFITGAKVVHLTIRKSNGEAIRDLTKISELINEINTRLPEFVVNVEVATEKDDSNSNHNNNNLNATSCFKDKISSAVVGKGFI